LPRHGPASDKEEEKEMFFIFGMPRSGTTLLAQCLNAHTEIVVPHETDFIIPMAFIFDRVRNENTGRELIGKLIINSAHFSVSLGEYIDAADVHEAVYSSEYTPAAILRAIYATVARRAGARLAGDKSPNDFNFLRILVKTGALSSDAKVIHVVRDIRDVMVSVNKTGWAAGLDAYFPRFWSNNNLYLNALYREDASHYALIRYEDFVADPREEIEKLCVFLGVEFEEGMLIPGNRHPRYTGQEHHANLYGGISDASVGRYREVFDAGVVDSYETQAREALIAFGYEYADV